MEHTFTYTDGVKLDKFTKIPHGTTLSPWSDVYVIGDITNNDVLFLKEYIEYDYNKFHLWTIFDKNTIIVKDREYEKKLVKYMLFRRDTHEFIGEFTKQNDNTSFLTRWDDITLNITVKNDEYSIVPSYNQYKGVRKVVKYLNNKIDSMKGDIKHFISIKPSFIFFNSLGILRPKIVIGFYVDNIAYTYSTEFGLPINIILKLIELMEDPNTKLLLGGNPLRMKIVSEKTNEVITEFGTGDISNIEQIDKIRIMYYDNGMVEYNKDGFITMVIKDNKTIYFGSFLQDYYQISSFLTRIETQFGHNIRSYDKILESFIRLHLLK